MLRSVIRQADRVVAAGLPVRARRHWRPLEPRTLALAVAGACAAGGAWAQVLPAGGVAVHGQAGISTPAPNQLVVTTRNGVGTGHSAINWQSFSLSAGSSARFVQPDAASLSINRVVTNTPSAIFGNLSSNGRLVLVNQSGITVGAGAVVDTAGFTASALRMTDADALAGRLRFGAGGGPDTMGGAAGLTVDGRITARDGDVVLIAPRIGVGASALVRSPNGSTILAAGQQVEITGRGLEGISLLVQARDDEARNLGRLEGDAVGIFAGTLRHSGAIQATTAALEGGQVVLQATGDALVQGTGTILATGSRGGRIDVLGDRVAVTEQALVDASGTTGGGRIRIGGDFQGRNPDIPNARKTFLGPNATLRADATGDGDGGRVIVWSDDYTQAHGAVSARGGPSGGDGGFVEVSGKRSLAFTAQVDTRAPLGLTGTLLLDPDFIDVDANGSAYVGDVLFGAGSGLLSLDVATINASLSNVVLQANEDINFNVAVSLANPGVSLTARAGGFLTVNGSITTKGGAVDLTAGDFGSLTGPSEGSLTVNQPIDTTGAGVFAAGAPVTLTSNLSDVGGNSIFINAGINAGTSSVTLDAQVGGPIDLAAGAITSGNLNLLASFDVNQTGGSISASGVTLLDASNVSLTRPGNNFNVFGGIANAVAVNDSNGITLGASSFSQLTVNANGNVGQNAAVIIGGITTINAGSGNVTLTTAGNNLNDLNVSGNALNIVEGAGSALAVLSLTSGLNQPVSLAAGHNLTLPGTAINTGTADLTLISGNTLTLPGALSGNNISLTAVAGLAVNAPIAATGNFDATVTGGASTMTVIRAVTAGADMTLSLAGNLSVLASGSGLAGLNAAGSQSISAGGNILLQGGGSGSSDRAVIESTDPAGIQAVTANGITLLGGADGGGVGTGNSASLRAAGDQVITVGNGGITLIGGGGSMADNYASIEHNGGAGTSQSITVNGTGSIVLQAGSSAGTGPGAGSEASIQTEFGDSQTILFTGTGIGRAITLTGGTVGGDSYAEIYAGLGTQSITGAGQITLTGGASGGGASFPVDDTTGNLAAISADLNDQTIVANGLHLQGGAGGLNNLAVVFGGGNQSITVGAGGLQLLGGGGGALDAKNAAIVMKGNDVPATSQTITVGGGGAIVLQGGNASASNVGVDANLLNLGNGAFASIRSDGIAQLIEFTAAGGSIQMTGGTVGSDNAAFIQAMSGSQTIRGSIASNAPAISLTGGAFGGVAGEGNRAVIAAELGSQSITAGSISITGGTDGTENLAQIRQGGVVAGLAETQTVTIVGGGNVAIQGGDGTTNLARIQAYGLTQTVALGSGGSLNLTGGTGATLNFARIEALNGDQFITGTADITLTGGASGGATGNGNFADIRQRNAAGLQSISAGMLALLGGDAGVENFAALTADGDQAVAADSIALTGGIAGDTNRTLIVSNSGSQAIGVGAGGLSVTGGSGSVTDRRNFASIFQGGLAGTSQTITVAGGGNVTLQAGDSAGTGVGLDNGSLAYITNQGDAQLIEFTGTGSAISITAGSVGSLNTAGILARNGSQTIRGSIAAHAPGIVVTGGSDGIVGEENGANIGAQTGAQVISAKSVTLNGGTGIDSFATITAPNQSIDIDGDLALQGAGGTGSSPGARIGGRGGATGSNTVLDLTVSGNLFLNAGAAAGAGIGSTSLASGLTNDIDITVGGELALTPSAGAGVRIGSRAGDVQAGTITVSAGSITTNAGDGASNVAAIRTLGNISLTSAAGVTEAIDTVIAADGLSVSAANGILMDSAANLVTHLFASVSSSGDIAYSQAAGSLLTVTGITQMPTGHDVVISADDINITGAVVAPSTITIRPVTLARGVAIEPVPGGAALSLSPTELQQISTQGLIIGRLDGTGDLVLGASLASNDVGTGAYLSLFAGGNLISNTGASLGNSGTPFEHHVELVANNDVQLTNGNVFVADNRNLRIYADNDGSGTGSVNIGAVTLKVGSGAGNTTGLMDIKGVGITAAVSGGGSALLEVTGAGSQTFTATGLDLAFHNLNAGSGNLTVQTASGTQAFSANLGALDLQAGTGTGTSVTLSAAAGPQTVDAVGVSLQGGAAGFNNSAFLFAGGGAQTITAGGSGISLTGGGGTGGDGNNSATISYSGTGAQTVSITGGGDMILTGGSSAAQNVGSGNGSRAIIQSSGTGNQMITLTGGDLTLQGGSVGSRNYAALFADLGSQTISGVNNLLLHGGNDGGVATEGNRATVHAGVNQTISATSIDLIGGNDGTENYARFLLYGPGASTQAINANAITLTGGAAGGGLDSGNFALIQSEASQAIAVGGGGDLTLTGGGGPLTDNAARIETSGGIGTQSVVLIGGGSINLFGGSSTATTVGATHGSRALINANASAQTIQVFDGGSINLTGGTAGQRNFAGITAQAGTQTISNAAGIYLIGGAAGGVPGEGNFAVINSEIGNQSISADWIELTGGAAGTENLAQIRQGSATGGLAASQNISVNGTGSLLLSGGGGTANLARIQAFGVSQTIAMGGTAALDLSGGTGASNNLARIHAVNGNQTISGNPDIRILGGASGGADLAGNSADIRASGPGADQTIAASNLELVAGAAGQENYAGVLALNQNITALGNVSLTGGGSATSLDGTSGGGARIGGMGGASPTATNLTLTVGNDLTLTGGSVAGALLGSNRLGGQPTTIIATAGGDITLNPGIASGAGSRIGSPASGPSAGDIFLTAGGSIALGGAVAGETAIRTLGDVTLDATTLALGNLVAGNTIFANADGAATISGVGQLSASAPSGDAIELVAGSSFGNSAGASALVTSAPARWLVYSSDPSLDTRGGLVYAFKQYDKIYGDANPILGSGNGFLYAIAPTASVSLTGTVSKVYDGTDLATLAAGNFLATGGIDGDVVSVGGGTSGSYDNRNVGAGKTVSVGSLTISALDGTAPVFGYALAGGTATGAVGTITTAALTVSTSAVSKPYDGTTGAAGSAIVTGGALFGSDTLSGGSFAFLDPNVGIGKTVTVSGVTVNDGNGGANYTVSFTNNTVSSITALAAANWNGLGGDNLWSNPANWDVLPITGNVLSVAIPAGGGTVVFDAAAGTTSLQSLTSQQAISVTGGSLVLGASLDAPSLNQSGGTLQVGTSLATGSLVQSAGTLEVGTSLDTGSLTQNGGTLQAGGNVTIGSFSQGVGASLTGTGALTVGSSFSQSGGSVTMGSIAISQGSGNLVTGNLTASTITLAAPAGAIGQTGALHTAALATQSATGTNLNQAANQIASLAASNSGTGDIVLVNGTALTLGTIANAGGNIDVVNTGAINAVGPVTATAGNVTIVANSPLTVGSGGIKAGGNITLHATNLTSAGDLTLNGVVDAGNTVSLTADANMVQNFAVIGLNGVTAAAAGSMTYGPLATTNAPPILYTAGGVPITPPPTVLASSLQPPGDIVVTFLELLQEAVDGPIGEDLQTNPDGSKKKRDEDEGIVTEEELCR